MEMMWFSVAYIAIMFLLVLNFILAIIVESYMKVANYCEELETEFGFFEDIYFAISGAVKGSINGWPTRVTVLGTVRKRDNAFAVTWDELIRSDRFKNQASAASFIQHYLTFDALNSTQKYARIMQNERKNPNFATQRRIFAMNRLVKQLHETAVSEVAKRTAMKRQLDALRITSRRMEKDNQRLHERCEELQTSSDMILRVVNSTTRNPTNTPHLGRSTAFRHHRERAEGDIDGLHVRRGQLSQDIEDDGASWEKRC
mmetsp:Transcript_43158/g.82315  ORF Transcript_43158/g.82315 Transcript_43158/m.82315 type:complete len:258 (-) Transcript_43158:376-1149(-)